MNRAFSQVYSKNGRDPALRVVVTGLGLVTPLGCTVQHVWERLLKGETGTQRLVGERYKPLPCQVGGLVPRGASTQPGMLMPENHVSKSDQRAMSTAALYAVVAAEEALQDAGWAPTSALDKERTGVLVGQGMLDLEEVVAAGQALYGKGYNRVTPFLVPRLLPNLSSGHVSMRFGLQGPNHCVSTACASGAHAIGDAMRLIAHGDADVMVCGGTEACMGPLAIASFCRMRALATAFNDLPNEASRPFDVRRDGFVMSEGAGVMVLESLPHALNRGARIHAELIGYGLSGDAHHVTAPREDGSGAIRSMTAAITQSQVTPSLVGYINAHATSTPLGDAAESRAVTNLFGSHACDLAVSSSKGALGHLLGASGSVEAIITALACREGVVPPTANLEQPSPGLDLNYVPRTAQEWPSKVDGPRRVALTNSFGFGGTNATLCFASFHY